MARKQHRGHSHSPARAGNQHPLTRLQPCGDDQRFPCGRKLVGCNRVTQRQFVGQGHQLVVAHHDVLGIGARQLPTQGEDVQAHVGAIDPAILTAPTGPESTRAYPLTDVPARDGRSERGDGSRSFCSQNMR